MPEFVTEMYRPYLLNYYQKKLFSMFDSNELDVELTDSCFMQPRKSISGVFGITAFNSNQSTHSYNPCLECNRRDCSERRNSAH